MKRVIFAGFIIFLAFTGCDDKKVQVETGDADKSTDDYDINDKDADNYIPDESCADPDNAEPDETYYDSDIAGDDTAEDVDYIELDDSTDSDTIPDELVSDEDVIECAVIGETVPVIPEALDCCEGLQKVGMMQLTYIEHRGYCESMDGSSVCINCGNSVCDLGENVCNCPQDCAEERDEKCDDGTTDLCDMMPPIACEPGFVLAIQESCWRCVDEITCK